jgi:hypothetical protein
MDNGPEKVEDAAELAQLKRQRDAIYMKSVALAVAITAVLYFVP